MCNTIKILYRNFTINDLISRSHNEISFVGQILHQFCLQIWFPRLRCQSVPFTTISMYLLYPDSYSRCNNYRRPPNNYVYWHIVPFLSLFQPGAHSWCNKYYRFPPIRYMHRERLTHFSVAAATTIIDVYPSSNPKTITIWTRSLSISVLEL